ncbi:MAG: prolyl oligopeptidase family serine peptidase, partial [Lentisphaerae bacterium]|nr:prolyl oligopeptidase family serine peptidase [Lentisphaerota bacterium]
VWAEDNRTVFYTLLEPDTYRPWQIRRHTVGTDPIRDPVVYEEPDPAFRCLLLASRSRRFILLNAYANDAEEILYLDASNPQDQFKVFCPRRQGHQYELEDDGRRFIVRTNWQAPDFRLCEAEIRPHSSPEEWRELLPGQKGRLLEQMAVFRNHIALTGFQDGAQRLFILDRRDARLHTAPMPEPVCHVWLEENPTLDTDLVRVGFTSLRHQVTFFDYQMSDRRLALVRREEPPGYQPGNYVTERLWARAPDGVRVPISVVYHKDTPRRGPAPLLLFGYGEYGTNIPVYFDQSRLVLLDRGFIYGMAHVRGGSELGCHWHQAGKRMNKRQTFTDFIACAEHLADCGLARRDQLYAESLSAGGLLLGAVINMRPDLFHGVYACKPFVDPLTTMADPNLPLTSFEYDEWGHPEKPQEWECLASYAPYDNIARQAYPHLLITAARNDSQVPCWEPAKWAARLRAHNTAATDILLKTEMNAGHAGQSGRRERLRELALLYTFLLSLAEATADHPAECKTNF